MTADASNLAFYKDLASLISLPVAALGLCATAIQMHRNRKFQRENTAKGIYRDYLKIAGERPILANGELGPITHADKYEEYQWFVSYMLWAMEEVLDYAPEDRIWRKDIGSQIEYHAAYLSGETFLKDEIGFYSDALKKEIAAAVQRAGSAKKAAAQ